MKQKIITALGCVVVVALIFVSVKYFRNGSPFSSMNNDTEETVQVETESEWSYVKI